MYDTINYMKHRTEAKSESGMPDVWHLAALTPKWVHQEASKRGIDMNKTSHKGTSRVALAASS